VRTSFLLAGLVLISAARGEVADSSASGFTVKITHEIKAAPEEVYRRLIHVGDWWNSSHSWSGDAHNLSIEERPGGCFCEKLPKGGGVRHMEVVYVDPGKLLRMTGALGPLQAMAATGTLSVELSPANGGTKLIVTYAAAGYFIGGMNALAAPVDEVISEQFTRLKNLIETGDAAKK